MNKLLLAFVTLSVFLYWDFIIRIKYIFNRKSIEKWLDNQFHHICNLLFSFTAFFVNVHIHFERPETLNLPETFMLISNHQSMQDIPVLIWSFPEHDLRFAAKESLFKWAPVVSQMLRIQQHGRINRHGGAAETMRTLERLSLKSREGYCPVIFPEGTRSKTGKVGVFHSGAVRKMLITNPIPVVAVAIDGGWRVGSIKEITKNMQNFNLKVKLIDVYEAPKSKSEVHDILEKASLDIKKQVDTWHVEDPGVVKTKKGHHIKPY